MYDSSFLGASSIYLDYLRCIFSKEFDNYEKANQKKSSNTVMHILRPSQVAGFQRNALEPSSITSSHKEIHHRHQDPTSAFPPQD